MSAILGMISCPVITDDMIKQFKAPPVLGRSAIVRYKGALVGATVIDFVAGTNLAKRLRITTGEHADDVAMPHEYEIVEFCERSEVADFLAAAWE